MTWIKERTRQLICIQPMPTHDFYDLVYIFFVGGLLGTFYEVLQYLLIHGLLEDRRGSVLTPVNYVYALGALAIFLVMYRMKKPLTILAWGTVLGGVVEYCLSIMQECILFCRESCIATRSELAKSLIHCKLSMIESVENQMTDKI